MDKEESPPQWGVFLAEADKDILSSAVLEKYEQWQHALYHGVQASEKYLKAKYLSLLASSGDKGYTAYESAGKKMRKHDLAWYWQEIECRDPSYGNFPWKGELPLLSEYDQKTRYPYVVSKVQNGMCDSDLELCYLIALQVRPDIVFKQDDYPLGIALRGYKIEEPKETDPTQAATFLMEYFPEASSLIWWPNKAPGAELKRRRPFIRSE